MLLHVGRKEGADGDHLEAALPCRRQAASISALPIPLPYARRHFGVRDMMMPSGKAYSGDGDRPAAQLDLEPSALRIVADGVSSGAGRRLALAHAHPLPTRIIHRPHLDLAPLEQALSVPLRITVEQPGVDADLAVTLAVLRQSVKQPHTAQ